MSIDVHEVLAADLREMGHEAFASDVYRRGERSGSAFPHVGPDARIAAYDASLSLCVELARMVMEGRDAFVPILEQTIATAVVLRPRGGSL